MSSLTNARGRVVLANATEAGEFAFLKMDENYLNRMNEKIAVDPESLTEEEIQKFRKMEVAQLEAIRIFEAYNEGWVGELKLEEYAREFIYCTPKIPQSPTIEKNAKAVKNACKECKGTGRHQDPFWEDRRINTECECTGGDKK